MKLNELIKELKDMEKQYNGSLDVKYVVFKDGGPPYVSRRHDIDVIVYDNDFDISPVILLGPAEDE